VTLQGLKSRVDHRDPSLAIVGNERKRGNIANTGCVVSRSGNALWLISRNGWVALGDLGSGRGWRPFGCPETRVQLRWWTVGIGLFMAGAAIGQESDELRVRLEVAPGHRFVGQEFELRVGVVGTDQRPKIEPPSIGGADVWAIGTDLKPISVSGIGAEVAEANLFVSRFRVVPRRSGALEIPAIPARIGSRSGRSRPARLSIRPVPPEGRPAEFLGGVGRFALQAEVTAKVVRVGQELDFRITVTGPAAWGMSDRPELKRYDRLGIGLRIEPKQAETTQEPPSCSSS
jgi:hypothetical protein